MRLEGYGQIAAGREGILTEVPLAIFPKVGGLGCKMRTSRPSKQEPSA
jgi:hypothetical protein